MFAFCRNFTVCWNCACHTFIVSSTSSMLPSSFLEISLWLCTSTLNNGITFSKIIFFFYNEASKVSRWREESLRTNYKQIVCDFEFILYLWYHRKVDIGTYFLFLLCCLFLQLQLHNSYRLLYVFWTVYLVFSLFLLIFSLYFPCSFCSHCHE